MIFALLAALTCADFHKLLTQTYGFRPSQLNAAAQTEKSRQMDAIWRAVENDPATLGPSRRIISMQSSTTTSSRRSS